MFGVSRYAILEPNRIIVSKKESRLYKALMCLIPLKFNVGINNTSSYNYQLLKIIYHQTSTLGRFSPILHKSHNFCGPALQASSEKGPTRNGKNLLPRKMFPYENLFLRGAFSF